MSFIANFRYSPRSGATRPSPVLHRMDGSASPPLVQTSEVVRAAEGREVLFITHGYEVEQAEGVVSLSRLATALDLPKTFLVIAVLWPGDSLAWKFGYPLEKKTATAVGSYLATFCNVSLGKAAAFSFASHSLGARLVLQTVRQLARKTRTICLAAAAIERDCLTAEFADAFARVERTALLASREDEVLAWAFRIGNPLAHLLQPSAYPFSSALGYAGPAGALGPELAPWQIPVSGAAGDYDHGSYLPSYDPADPFPDPPAKWNRPAAFVRRAVLRQPQIWP